MFRYLKEAFLARPELPGLGPIPWNLLGVAGVGILGFAEPSIWLAGLGLEALYLFSIAPNVRFQRWVDGQALLRGRGVVPAHAANPAETLGPAARERLAKLAEKIGRIEALYRENRSEDYLFASNREALQKLAELFVKLLVAQKNILANSSGPQEHELKGQMTQIEQTLGGEAGSQTLRESKRATLQIIQQRMRNLQRRDETLAEIDSDLTRIEAQIGLALEEATLEGRPTAISANIQLVSHLLDDHLLDIDTTTSPERQIEN